MYGSLHKHTKTHLNGQNVTQNKKPRTWLPYVQVCVQRVSALRRALAKLLLAHGAQVLPRQVLEGVSCVGQPVQMFDPQQPLLDVPRVPLDGV